RRVGLRRGGRQEREEGLGRPRRGGRGCCRGGCRGAGGGGRRGGGRGAHALLGGDPAGEVDREGGELRVVLGGNDLGVVLAGVEQRAARRGVALRADVERLRLVGLLRAVLAERLELVAQFEDVELDLVRVVAVGVVVGVG